MQMTARFYCCFCTFNGLLWTSFSEKTFYFFEVKTLAKLHQHYILPHLIFSLKFNCCEKDIIVWSWQVCNRVN